KRNARSRSTPRPRTRSGCSSEPDADQSSRGERRTRGDRLSGSSVGASSAGAQMPDVVVQSRRLGSHTQDDGFHEIQLNGKQLVFLFMAATVVSVVIFLCGVLVGRGVKTERAVSSADAAAVAAVAEPAPPPAAVTASPVAGSDPTTAAPPPAVGDLTYFNRLEK